MQAAQQPDKHASHSQCLQTEFGQICCAQPFGQKPFQPVVFEGVRGVEAVDHLSTKFGDVKFEDPETLRSVQTEFGEVTIVGMFVLDPYFRTAVVRHAFLRSVAQVMTCQLISFSLASDSIP